MRQKDFVIRFLVTISFLFLTYVCLQNEIFSDEASLVYPNSRLLIKQKYLDEYIIRFDSTDGGKNIREYYERVLNNLGWKKVGSVFSAIADNFICKWGEWGGIFQKGKTKFRLTLAGSEAPKGEIVFISFYIREGEGEVEEILGKELIKKVEDKEQYFVGKVILSDTEEKKEISVKIFYGILPFDVYHIPTTNGLKFENLLTINFDPYYSHWGIYGKELRLKNTDVLIAITSEGYYPLVKILKIKDEPLVQLGTLVLRPIDSQLAQKGIICGIVSQAPEDHSLYGLKGKKVKLKFESLECISYDEWKRCTKYKPINEESWVETSEEGIFQISLPAGFYRVYNEDNEMLEDKVYVSKGWSTCLCLSSHSNRFNECLKRFEKSGDDSSIMESIFYLIRKLNDEDDSVRKAAAAALDNFKDKGVIFYLIDALEDEDSGIRAQAASALAYLADENIIPKLQRIIDKEKEEWIKEKLKVTIERLRNK